MGTHRNQIWIKKYILLMSLDLELKKKLGKVRERPSVQSVFLEAMGDEEKIIIPPLSDPGHLVIIAAGVYSYLLTVLKNLPIIKKDYL